MNDQMNNRLTVNDESVPRMIDNNSAMYYSNQMIIALNMTHQPKWCLEQRFGDGEIVTDQKLRRGPDGTAIVLGRESVFVYVKDIADMYNNQRHLA
ncbi:hypothetical protein G6F67_008513 [Rhizopus microsporus]|nr:hypothetical protein G6F67_008513 [Rhizopus microsporus]